MHRHTYIYIYLSSIYIYIHIYWLSLIPVPIERCRLHSSLSEGGVAYPAHGDAAGSGNLLHHAGWSWGWCGKPKKNNGNGNHNNGSLISNKYHTTNHSQLSEEIDGKSHLQVWRFIDGYTPLDRHFTKNDVKLQYSERKTTSNPHVLSSN